MKLLATALAFIVLFTACSSSKKAAKTNSPNLTPQSTVEVTTASTSVDHDGSSFEKAIFITEKTETTGVHAEYEWLKKNYPGYTMIKQSLINKGRKPYDILKIKTKDGEEKEICFDISNFFGKF